ncbi:MAG: acyltransferase family protein [Acidimicrobiales bacterium]
MSFGFIPALDGLRAVAVLGVMMYHGGVPFLSGGFLTIDVFFVLSGFLITSLLLGEWSKRMTIQLRQFWARRARRLLPALLVMLLAVAVFAKLLAAPGEFTNLRLDILSTLFYVANWHFIFAGTNYFTRSAHTSPLQPMWSLSIEEQFYVVWPLVVLVMLRLGRKLRASRRLWPLFATAVIGAVASVLDMGLLYTGPSSVMRVYEGTDTRVQDLLVGAALAVGMAIWAQHRRVLPEPARRGDSSSRVPAPASRKELQRQRHAPSIKPIGAWEITGNRSRKALAVLGWAAIGIFAYLWSHLSVPGRFLFEGGYLLVAAGVAVVIFVAVTNQAGSVSKVLSNPVFRYVGKISYGAYLWHFPIFAALSASDLHLIGYPLVVIRIGVTLLVASASFQLVEEPVRRGGLQSLTEWRAWLTTSGAVLTVIAVTVAATVPTAAGAAPRIAGRIAGPQYAGPPVNLTVFGDSVASRLAQAMLVTDPRQTYDVNIQNGAIIGCGVVRTTEYRSHGVVNQMAAPCNPTTPVSQQWPAQWAGDLRQFHPNVVAMLVGRWEVDARFLDGRWQHIGQPDFNGALRRSLEEAVRVGTSTGALMIMMTSPCFDSGEQPNGQPWPEDSASRLHEFNTILRQVAAQFPTTVEVDNFGAQLCPGGHFTLSLNGVQVRSADGVHIVPTVAAGQWLDQRVLPEVVRVGRLQMEGRKFPPSVAVPVGG